MTDGGRKALRHWLTLPQSLPALRDPLLIQVFFSALLSNAEIIAVLEHQHSEHSKLLAYYQQKVPFALDAPAVLENMVSREQLLQRQVLEYSIMREQTYLKWLEQTIATVRRLGE